MRTNDLLPTPHSPFPTRPESCSAHLSVKQAAQNRAVAPNGSIPSRLTLQRLRLVPKQVS